MPCTWFGCLLWHRRVCVKCFQLERSCYHYQRMKEMVWTYRFWNGWQVEGCRLLYIPQTKCALVNCFQCFLIHLLLVTVILGHWHLDFIPSDMIFHVELCTSLVKLQDSDTYWSNALLYRESRCSSLRITSCSRAAISPTKSATDCRTARSELRIYIQFKRHSDRWTRTYFSVIVFTTPWTYCV
jgi:hypothetical protein